MNKCQKLKIFERFRDLRSQKKSQISMEFLALIGFVFIVAFGLILAAGTQLQDFRDNRDRELVYDFGTWLKNELDIASNVHDGYIREITLPDKIEDILEYSLRVNTTTIDIQAEHTQYIGLIPPVEGFLQKGKNTIKKNNGKITIENG